MTWQDRALQVACPYCHRRVGMRCVTTTGARAGSLASTHSARWESLRREQPWEETVHHHLPRNAAGQVSVTREMRVGGWEATAAAFAIMRATSGLQNTALGVEPHACYGGLCYASATLLVHGWRDEALDPTSKNP